MPIKPFFNYESKIKPLREYIRHGLTSGWGKPEPGRGCVEAAVNVVLGLPHKESPVSCVGEPDLTFAIYLNDAPWSSDAARAEGMVDLAIAHLGSATMTPAQREKWVRYIAEGIIKRVLPMALRASELIQEAQRCEEEGTAKAARAAEEAALSADKVWAMRAAANAAKAAERAQRHASEAAACSAWSPAGAAALCAVVLWATAPSPGNDAPLREAAKIAVEAYELVREKGK